MMERQRPNSTLCASESWSVASAAASPVMTSSFIASPTASPLVVLPASGEEVALKDSSALDDTLTTPKGTPDFTITDVEGVKSPALTVRPRPANVGKGSLNPQEGKFEESEVLKGEGSVYLQWRRRGGRGKRQLLSFPPPLVVFRSGKAVSGYATLSTLPAILTASSPFRKFEKASPWMICLVILHYMCRFEHLGVLLPLLAASPTVVAARPLSTEEAEATSAKFDQVEVPGTTVRPPTDNEPGDAASAPLPLPSLAASSMLSTLGTAAAADVARGAPSADSSPRRSQAEEKGKPQKSPLAAAFATVAARAASLFFTPPVAVEPIAGTSFSREGAATLVSPASTSVDGTKPIASHWNDDTKGDESGQPDVSVSKGSEAFEGRCDEGRDGDTKQTQAEKDMTAFAEPEDDIKAANHRRSDEEGVWLAINDMTVFEVTLKEVGRFFFVRACGFFRGCDVEGDPAKMEKSQASRGLCDRTEVVRSSAAGRKKPSRDDSEKEG